MAFIESTMDMEKLVKQNFLNKEEKILFETNPVQKILRDDLEICMQQLAASELKYKNIIDK